MSSGPLSGALSLLSCFNKLKHHTNITSFKLLESLYCWSISFKHTKNLGSVFPNSLIVEFARPNSQQTPVFLFFFHILFVLPLYLFPSFCSCNAGNGNAVPLQAWSGPEGSRKLRFPDFTTTAQEVGKVVSLTHRPQLPPGNPPGTHFC